MDTETQSERESQSIETAGEQTESQKKDEPETLQGLSIQQQMELLRPDEEEVQALLEGMVLLSGEEGISLIQMQMALEQFSREELSDILKKIKEEYAPRKHGFHLEYYGGRYRFVCTENVFEKARKIYENIQTPTLSSASLETLAIIAYKQPITRVEIEEIRGVSCDAILRKLQLRSLIEAKDRLDAPGNPLLYTITDTFLDVFGLESLQDLPILEKEEIRQGLFDSPVSPENDSSDNSGSLSD